MQFIHSCTRLANSVHTSNTHTVFGQNLITNDLWILHTPNKRIFSHEPIVILLQLRSAKFVFAHMDDICVSCELSVCVTPLMLFFWGRVGGIWMCGVWKCAVVVKYVELHIICTCLQNALLNIRNSANVYSIGENPKCIVSTHRVNLSC